MSKQHTPPWVRVTRYHCDICNVWMDNSTLAIKHHEQGKKHRENAEKNQRKMREARAAKQREEKALQDQLAAIESEAAKLSAADRVGGYGLGSHSHTASSTSGVNPQFIQTDYGNVTAPTSDKISQQLSNNQPNFTVPHPPPPLAPSSSSSSSPSSSMSSMTTTPLTSDQPVPAVDEALMQQYAEVYAQQMLLLQQQWNQLQSNLTQEQQAKMLADLDAQVQAEMLMQNQVYAQTFEQSVMPTSSLSAPMTSSSSLSSSSSSLPPKDGSMHRTSSSDSASNELASAITTNTLVKPADWKQPNSSSSTSSSTSSLPIPIKVETIVKPTSPLSSSKSNTDSRALSTDHPVSRPAPPGVSRAPPPGVLSRPTPIQPSTTSSLHDEHTNTNHHVANNTLERNTPASTTPILPTNLVNISTLPQTTGTDEKGGTNQVTQPQDGESTQTVSIKAGPSWATGFGGWEVVTTSATTTTTTTTTTTLLSSEQGKDGVVINVGKKRRRDDQDEGNVEDNFHGPDGRATDTNGPTHRGTTFGGSSIVRANRGGGEAFDENDLDELDARRKLTADEELIQTSGNGENGGPIGDDGDDDDDGGAIYVGFKKKKGKAKKMRMTSSQSFDAGDDDFG